MCVPQGALNFFIMIYVIVTFGYRDKIIEQKDPRELKTEDLIKVIKIGFTENAKDSLERIKAKIGEIYNKLNYPAHPKATEIKDWFEVSKVRITSSLSGFKLIKRRF